LFADGNSDSDLLRALPDARASGGIAKREVSLGTRSVPTGYRSASACARFPDQHHPAAHGGYAGVADGDDAEDGRSHATPHNDVYAAYLPIFLLQFCGGSGIILHRAKSFQYPAILAEQTALEKVAPAGKRKR
jgi:hypothetical protein